MRQHWLYCVVVALLLTSMAQLANAADWQPIEKGLLYRQGTIETTNGPAPIHLFHIDPHHFQFKLLSAKEMGKASAYVSEYVKHFKPVLAFNGGFFSPRYEPLGLRVNTGRELSSSKEISWWSVLVAKQEGLSIVRTADFRLGSTIEMAIQAGPRLVIDGAIPTLKPGKANRTAVGLQRNGTIIVAIVPAPVSTTQLAEKLARSESQGGAECLDAINLDGGSSTQLIASSGKFQLKIDGLASVVDAIGIYRR